MQSIDKYYNSDEFQNILQEYEEKLAGGGSLFMDSDDLADIADYYHCQGREAEAIEALNTALELNPDALLPRIYQAREMLDRHAFSEAQAVVDTIIDKNDYEVQLLQAEIWLAQDLNAEADGLLRQMLDEADEPEHDNTCFDIANLYKEYGRYKKALKWADQMRNPAEDDYELKELKAMSLIGIQKYDEAEALYNELLDADPYSTEYWLQLAHVQFIREQYDECINSCDFAIAIDTENPYAYAEKGNAFYAQELYKEAIECYQKVTELLPEDSDALQYLGGCLLDVERYEEALHAFRNLLSLAKGDKERRAYIYEEIVYALVPLKRYDEALNIIDRLKRNYTEYVNIDSINVLHGNILLEQGELREAALLFSEAVEHSGRSPYIIMRIGVSLYDNGFVEGAYNTLKLIFDEHEETMDEGFSYIALCCYDLKKYDEFLHYLAKAVDLFPREAKLVLGRLMPEGMQPKDYYRYMKSRIDPTPTLPTGGGGLKDSLA